MKKKILAFTLAEVLIVIGIIGVVAALTLPNLNHATGDKETVTKVKKIYSTLNEAFDRAQVIYGDANSWWEYGYNLNGTDFDSHRIFTDRIAEFLKIKSKTFDTITMSDGTKLTISVWQPGNSIYIPNADYLGYIDVDIDGPNKGKNQVGYDRFRFDITSQGIYPEGIAEADINYIFDDYTRSRATKWVLENDNLDYLKANESGVCPNGVQLSWTQTSCN